MKRVLTGWVVFLVAVFVLPVGAMADPNFMVNVSTSGSDAFFKVVNTPDGGYATFGEADDVVTTTKFNPYGHMEWAKTFTGIGSSNCSVGAAGDDGLFISGKIGNHVLWIAKLDYFGAVIWQKQYVYGGYTSFNPAVCGMVALDDGGCLVKTRIKADSGSTYNFELGLIRLDANGDIDWSKMYGTPNYDYTGTVIAVKDAEGNADGFLMAFQEDGWGGTDLDNEVILVKVSVDGAKQWAKAYAGYGTDNLADGNEFLKGVTQTSDLGYAIAGQSYSASDPSWEKDRRIAFLLKVNNDGSAVQWAKRFGSLTTDPETSAFTYADVTEAADSTDLLVAGHTNLNEFWLLRFSADGSLINEKGYPSSDSTGKDQLGSIAPTADGGAVAARWSKTYGSGDYDAFMMKFDADLTLSGTECDSGFDPASEIADMRFDVQDVTENCHEIVITDQWTVTATTNEAYDPGFYLWYCAENADADGDGVYDHLDNCPLTANADQIDTDGDGTGNACDCDLDNDGLVGRNDYIQFRSQLNSSDEEADFNADGAVDRSDYTILRSLFNTDYPWY